MLAHPPARRSHLANIVSYYTSHKSTDEFIISDILEFKNP